MKNLYNKTERPEVCYKCHSTLKVERVYMNGNMYCPCCYSIEIQRFQALGKSINAEQECPKCGYRF